MKPLAIAMLAVAMMSEVAFAQTLIGSTVTVSGRYPTRDTLSIVPVTAVVGPAVEFSQLTAVPGLGGFTVPVSIDIGASTIDLNYRYSYTGTHVAFDGPYFDFAGASARITSVSIDPGSSSSLAGVVLAWTSTHLDFDAANIAGFSPGDHLRLNLTLAPIPEPSALLLSIVGVVFIYGVAINRRAINGDA